jgi:hypothetical protein
MGRERRTLSGDDMADHAEQVVDDQLAAEEYYDMVDRRAAELVDAEHARWRSA